MVKRLQSIIVTTNRTYSSTVKYLQSLLKHLTENSLSFGAAKRIQDVPSELFHLVYISLMSCYYFKYSSK